MALARIFHIPMMHRALRLRKRTAMRAREAPRLGALAWIEEMVLHWIAF